MPGWSRNPYPGRQKRFYRDTGHKTWIDAENIRAGWSWDREITEAIRSSDAVLGILTPDSIKSENVLDEWAYALANDIPLILLLVIVFTIVTSTSIWKRWWGGVKMRLANRRGPVA